MITAITSCFKNKNNQEVTDILNNISQVDVNRLHLTPEKQKIFTQYYLHKKSPYYCKKENSSSQPKCSICSAYRQHKGKYIRPNLTKKASSND